MRKCLLIWLFFFFGLAHAIAIETIIVGDVVSEMGEPIPNASVYFRGTKVGTATNEEGAFVLRVDLGATLKLKVSAVGYESQLFVVQPGQHAGLQVMLREKRMALGDVFVLPGANPAMALMDSVRRKAPASSVESGGKSTRQMYILSNKSGTTRIPDTLANSLPLSIPEHLDFYHHSMPWGDVSFLSPVSRSGEVYYRYFLADSIVTPEGKIYQVDFLPKNSFNPLLRGRLYIDSATYLLSRVEATLPYRANVNFLSQMRYSAQYSNGKMLTDSLNAVLAINFLRDTVSSHQMSRLMVEQYGAFPNPIAQIEQSPVWQQRIDVADASVNSQIPDSGRFAGLFRFATWMAYTVHTGYFYTGTPVDIGKISEIIRYSNYEGLHLGLPFRTNERLMKHVSLEGYVAYGFRDRGIKWKLGMNALLPTAHRNLIGAHVWDRYVDSEVNEMDLFSSENSIAYTNKSFSNFLFSDVCYALNSRQTTALRRQEARIWWESEWNKSRGSIPSVESTLSVTAARTAARYGEWVPNSQLWDADGFTTIALSGQVRLGWGEQVRDFFTIRKHIYSTFPTLYLGATMGNWNSSKSGPNLYGRFDLVLRQSVHLGIGGHLDYNFRAGCVLGDVPFFLLNTLGGNSGYTFDPLRFTLIQSRELTARSFLALQANWNGGGILFNYIPGIRYLRLRELLEVKVAYTFNRLPYTELGVGIGNILQVGELYGVFRLSAPQSLESSWWGIRFRLHVGM